MKLKKLAGITILALLLLLVVAAVAIRVRGFRASTEPSAFEASIARAVRDFAIPGTESRRKNPYVGDELALQQGRDLFLARCASCHGTDGRGTTPIGRNVYPRVPDLRQSPTQRLSDGEIHYIIENGVQLTGMPAWNKSGSDDDIWKLVL